MTSSHREIRVLQSFSEPRATTNPYIVMLGQALDATPGVQHLTFSWARALFGRYDVIHLHWPETLFSASNRFNAMMKRVTFLALLTRVRVMRTPVVRTVHNLHLPQDVSALQRWILERVEDLATLRIRIGETTPLPPEQPSVLILHGDYRAWFARVPRRDTVAGRLSFVGLVRRYKGVEALISAFQSIPTDLGSSLAVSGKPSTEELATELTALTHGDPRISLNWGFLDDDAFVARMTEAAVVVLPYRFMHNSGSVLAALSLDRPVLVPANEANDALAREVGEGWIIRYAGDLRSEDLVHAVTTANATRRTPPDLSLRGWDETGARHLEAYHQAMTLKRGKRSQ